MSAARIKRNDRIEYRQEERKCEQNCSRKGRDRNAAVEFVLIEARFRVVLSIGVDGRASRRYARKAGR